MDKYVFDLSTDDVLLVDNQRVIIDSFTPISDDTLLIGGYYEDSGDDYSGIHDVNDEITIDKPPRR